MVWTRISWKKGAEETETWVLLRLLPRDPSPDKWNGTDERMDGWKNGAVEASEILIVSMLISVFKRLV